MRGERRPGPAGGPPPQPPKLPPPTHGIRARRFGSTWWGRRWIEALERFSQEYSARLGRGRLYARQGRVHDLTVEGGTVQARVTGTRLEPYAITVQVAPLSDRSWERATRAMAEKAIVAAQLLAGEMPREIHEVFRAGGASLFPTRPQDLTTECSCPDWANPCKHVAAVHYVLGEFFDKNPFLLFELRGRSKDTVLTALRELRAGTAGARPAPAAEPAETSRAVELGELTPQQYGAWRGRVRDLSFRIEPPAVSGALFQQLGTPASWQLPVPFPELLQPAVARAATMARELALGTADGPPGGPTAPEPAVRRPPAAPRPTRSMRP